MFQELDERINYVATKVIHLGDQLESVNTPRSRAVEAQRLMSHFAEFLSSGPITMDKSQVSNVCFNACSLSLTTNHFSEECFIITLSLFLFYFFYVNRSMKLLTLYRNSTL